MCGKALFCSPKPLARVKERFAGNAADAQAGAAERGFLLNARDIQAKLRRADSGCVTAWPGPDNDKIVLLRSHKESWSENNPFTRMRTGSFSAESLLIVLYTIDKR